MVLLYLGRNLYLGNDFDVVIATRCRHATSLGFNSRLGFFTASKLAFFGYVGSLVDYVMFLDSCWIE